MAVMSNFPPLRAAVLQGLLFIKQGLDNDPSFLDQADYDGETKKVIGQLFAVKVVEKIVEVEKPEAAEKRAVGRPSKNVDLSDKHKQMIADTIDELITALKEMGTGEGLATNERIQITKTKAGLTDQLLKMRERNTGAERVEEFKNRVTTLLHDFGNETDRKTIMERIRVLDH